MITLEQKIIDQQNFNVKFADGAFDAEAKLNPGWAEPTFEDDFYTRLQDTPELLQQSRVVRMQSLQYDLDNLDVELDFVLNISLRNIHFRHYIFFLFSYIKAFLVPSFLRFFRTKILTQYNIVMSSKSMKNNLHISTISTIL